MAEELIVLDHVDDISVSSDKHTNSLNVLRSLRIGMYNLAQSTRQREASALVEQGDNIIRHVFQVNDETLMLGCVFDWFSVSLVSYLRLVKLIDLMESNQWEIEDLRIKEVREGIKNACPQYINSVAPAVYKWRNKIAAHRAATDPLETDNLTTLTYSTMPMVTFNTPYYSVGELRLFMSGGGSLDIDPWSLTRTFEDLASRLWPEVELTPLPSWATN